MHKNYQSIFIVSKVGRLVWASTAAGAGSLVKPDALGWKVTAMDNTNVCRRARILNTGAALRGDVRQYQKRSQHHHMKKNKKKNSSYLNAWMFGIPSPSTFMSLASFIPAGVSIFTPLKVPRHPQHKVLNNNSEQRVSVTKNSQLISLLALEIANGAGSDCQPRHELESHWAV